MELVIANTGANISSVETYFDRVHKVSADRFLYTIRENSKNISNNSPRSFFFMKSVVSYSEDACYGKHICFVLSSVVFSLRRAASLTDSNV